MKIKSRNLLTVILALLCAVAVGLGVSFTLPKNDNITANAASAPEDEIKIMNVNPFYKTYAGNINYSVANLTDSSLPNGGLSTSDTDLTFSQSAGINHSQFIYVDFKVGVTVPAWEEWEISYDVEFSALVTTSESWLIAGNIYYFKPDTSTNDPNDTLTNSSSITLSCRGCSEPSGADCHGFSGDRGFTFDWTYSSDASLKLTNKSNSSQLFTFSYGMAMATCYGSNPSAYARINAYNATLTNRNVKINAFAPATADGGITKEEVYTGSAINFKIDRFLSNNVELTNFTGTNFDGNALSVSVADINAIGEFKLILAGIYKATFNLTSSALTNGAEWVGGGTDTKTLTFTVKRKAITVPTITNSPQTYDAANGSSFSVSSDYDAATMTGAGVTSGVSWNAGSTCFTATNAGTYNVKFQLLDTNNYVWDVGVNGTTADQPATVKVDPKQLTVPTVTAPQEYTGSAVQFVLSDFNNGQYIKMDGVTAANGSAVTGALGAATTDTTDTFEAIKVGKYTVALSLRDTANYAWTDNTNTAKNVEFEITQKELLSTPPVSSKVNGMLNAEWQYGDNAVTVTITDDRATGENINLLCYYDVLGGTSKSNTLTSSTVGNVTTITMPATIAMGKYTLTVELNGNTGDNANYKITTNNTLNFEVTSGKIDPGTYGWVYTVDGAAGSTITDGDKLPFKLKTGSAVDGVKYELAIQIPTSDASAVAVDTSKYANGYQLRSGDSVGTYRTVVALKSTDPTFKFEVNGVMQDTIEVGLNWEIEKGTFDLSGVKWEYNLDGTTAWTEYNAATPPQYNDGNYITVRVKATTLPMGLTLDGAYAGMEKSDVNTYTATISASDFAYNPANFNAPDTSLLTLNWEIAKKNLYTRFKNVTEPYTNANYSGNIILKKLDVPAGMENYVIYEYYDQSTGLQVTLADIKDATDPTNEKQYTVKAYIDPAYAANYTVDDNGSAPGDTFKTGSSNKLATATINGNDGSTPIKAEYDGNTHFESTLVTVTSDDGINVTDFTVKYYKGTTVNAANELAAGDLPKDAGEYCIEIILGSVADRRYILAKETFTVTIEAKGITIPTFGGITFNGKEQNFEDSLGGSWNEYKSIIKIDGKLSDRNVGAGGYVTTLELTDSNYKWVYPTAVTTKSLAKHSLTSDGVSVTGDDVTATYNWNITPLVVDTANMWNKSKSGATLNLPQNIRDLIAAGTLEVGYRYYDGDGQYIEEPEIKGGRSFKVEAVFGGDDAERNVQFKTGDAEYGAVSKSIDYTVPQSGAAAFANNVKEFMTKTWLGLPIWAWLIIAVAVLILLIVIIAVACKRRKSKEEREAKKAEKEEEKRRKEEERQLQKEKLEAERELARAKQEAELEKIRAQANTGMGAGMAGMAMQQPMQQQAMPVQQSSDSNSELLREMSRQMAELRADNKATQAQLQAMQNNQQQMPMMQQYPMYQQMPMGNYGGIDGGALARLESQITAMQAEQRARYDAEQRAELAAMRAEQQVDRDSRHSVDLAAMREHYNGRMGDYVQGANQSGYNGQANSMDMLGALVAATLKNMANGVTPAVQQQPVAELPQKVEQSEPVTTKYPPDAVVTTTTTVDTTKNNVIRRESDADFVDVDGFYDPLD